MSPVLLNGKDISPDIAYLISLGVIPPETAPDFYLKEASFEEAWSWLMNTQSLLGKKNSAVIPKPSPLNFTNLAHLIIDSFEWEDRVNNLFLQDERDYILKSYEQWNGEAGEHLAYLVQAGIFPSSEDVQDPERAVARGELHHEVIGSVTECVQLIC